MATTGTSSGCNDRNNRLWRYLTIALATVSGAPAAACRSEPTLRSIDRFENAAGRAAVRLRSAAGLHGATPAVPHATRALSGDAQIHAYVQPDRDALAALSADDRVRALAEGR